MTSKKQLPKVVRLLIKLFQTILFIPIQLAFIPIIIVGMIDAVYKEFTLSKKLKVSFTAIQSLQYRWVMHYFGTREDVLSVKFVKAFPCESHFGLWATYGALIISQRLFGFKTKFNKLDEVGREGVFSTAGRRVLMFDDIVKKHIDEVEQIVLPGSGFDLIAHHFTQGKNVKVYEVDQSNTLKVKQETLKKAGIISDSITYVPVDYSKENWAEKLIESGYDKTKKTLFIWQSVSMYLDEETVKTSLKQMADISPAGSIIAQDLYSKKFINGQSSATAKKTANMFAKMGEPWKFGIDMHENPKESAKLFLDDCNLKMTEFYLFGEKLKTNPYYCIVEAKN